MKLIFERKIPLWFASSIAVKRRLWSGRPMKRAKTDQPKTVKEEMLPEYDLRGRKGVRGKYYQAYREGHTVRIRKADGAVSIQHFTLEDGAVMLEPDVREYFPDSAAVNSALRSLIALIPSKSAKARAGK